MTLASNWRALEQIATVGMSEITCCGESKGSDDS